jgi:hypothetical protein
VSQQIRSSAFLRKVLMGDALVSACVVVVLTLGAGALGPVIGVPAGALVLVGLALVPWVALLLWTGTRPAVPPGAVWAVIGLNAAGAAVCALVAFGLGSSLTPTGIGFMALNGLGALLLAELEYMGLRRSTPAAG